MQISHILALAAVFGFTGAAVNPRNLQNGVDGVQQYDTRDMAEGLAGVPRANVDQDAVLPVERRAGKDAKATKTGGKGAAAAKATASGGAKATKKAKAAAAAKGTATGTKPPAKAKATGAKGAAAAAAKGTATGSKPAKAKATGAAKRAQNW